MELTCSQFINEMSARHKLHYIKCKIQQHDNAQHHSQWNLWNSLWHTRTSRKKIWKIKEQTLWCQELRSEFHVYITHGSRWYTSDLHLVTTDHLICPTLGLKNRRNWCRRVCSQAITAHFMSACSKLLASEPGVQKDGNHCIPHWQRACDWLQRYNWETTDHPPYSLNLTPSDFHVSGPLKKHLTDQ
jgi:hypothetical protein